MKHFIGDFVIIFTAFFIVGLAFIFAFFIPSKKTFVPVDLSPLTQKIDLLEKQLKDEKEYSARLEKQNTENYLEDQAFTEARCICKNYSGPVDAKGQYIESYPENRQLTKQQICI